MATDPRIPGINLKDGEEVVFIAKPHWIVFIGLRRFIYYVMTAGLGLVWLILRRKNEVYVLTTQRVIEQYGVISKSQGNVDLSKIQDVQFKVTGLLDRILNVGNVHVETAGSSSNVEMLGVAKPQELCDLVQNEIGAAKKRELHEMAVAIKGAVA